MADPTIQSFCCRQLTKQRHQLLAADSLMDEFSTQRYLVTSIVAATLGMIGAAYQIIIRYFMSRNDSRLNYLQTMQYVLIRPRMLAQHTGKKIIIWLAIADLLASAGVFLRAALWVYFLPTSNISETPRVIFCAVISCWIQFFYTCTWLWTFCYAINIRLYLRNSYLSESKYHFIVWTTSALLTGIGTTVLYYPNANCHNFQVLYTALTRVLPNYCATYLPIVFVMVINPILYMSASKNVSPDVRLNSHITQAEKKVISILKWKFCMINLVFYICWMPNLICGFVLWTFWHNLPTRFLIIIWYLMAILNPLQAFLNMFVYRKWQLSTGPHRNRMINRSVILNESSPLLQAPQKWTTDSLHTGTSSSTSTTSY